MLTTEHLTTTSVTLSRTLSHTLCHIFCQPTGEDEVTFGAVKEMDLIADFLISGVLTEEKLVYHFSKAGGRIVHPDVHKSTLDLQVITIYSIPITFQCCSTSSLLTCIQVDLQDASS